MKTAIYQAGYAIFGIGSDLESAVYEANKWLDLPTSTEEIETPYHGEIHGNLYQARISDALANLVSEKGGDVEYIRITGENILVTQEEYEAI